VEKSINFFVVIRTRIPIPDCSPLWNWDFRRFMSISIYIFTGRFSRNSVAILLTDADKRMNPLRFRSDPADTRIGIGINPEIRTQGWHLAVIKVGNQRWGKCTTALGFTTLSIFMKFEALERWVSIIEGGGVFRGGAIVRPVPDAGLTVNFCIIFCFVSFASRLSRKICVSVPRLSEYSCFLPIKTASKSTQSYQFDFYRAMRCKRGLCCHAVSVRLSVCLSVTFVDHVKTNKDIFEIFSPSDDTILVCPPQRGADIPTEPPNGGVECKRGMIKWRFFSQISGCNGCISEMVIDRLAHAARQFVSIAFSFHSYNI